MTSRRCRISGLFKVHRTPLDLSLAHLAGQQNNPLQARAQPALTSSSTSRQPVGRPTGCRCAEQVLGKGSKLLSGTLHDKSLPDPCRQGLSASNFGGVLRAPAQARAQVPWRWSATC